MKILKITLLIIITIAFMNGRSPHKKGGEKARMLMKWKLTEYLDISEKQGDSFFPKYNTFQKKQNSIHEKIGKLFDQVEEMIDDGKINSNEVKNIQNEINDLEHDRHIIRSEFINNCQDILSEEQIAKLIVFKHKFTRKMKKELNQKDDHFRRKKGNKRNSHRF